MIRTWVGTPRSIALLATAVALLLVAGAHAAPGDLDTSFGSGGLVINDFEPGGEGAEAVVVQPDGRIVVAVGGMSFGAARFNADGSVDSSFAGDGKATTTFNGVNGFAAAIARQSDGRLVVGGNVFAGGSLGYALARYNIDGALDPTFDGDGTVTTAFPGFNGISHVVIQPDGKIVASGGGTAGFTLARYNSNGSLDTTFDGDGKVETGPGAAGAVVLQPDGKIIAAGSGLDAAFTRDFKIVRYLPNGSLDTSFDGDGIVTTEFAPSGSPLTNDSAEDVVVQPDGRIVAAGTAGVQFGAARYNPDGTLDASFDGDGRVTTRFFGQDIEGARGLALQADGRIVVAGEATSDGDRHMSLARYEPNGGLDTTFGSGGLVTTDFGDPSNDIAADVTIQADGKIVAVGGAGACLPRCLTVLARYDVAAADPGDLLDDLIADVAGIGPGTSLLDKLTAAKAALDAGNQAGACDKLAAFVKQVQAQSGKKLTAERAAGLESRAAELRSLLDC